MRRKYKKQNLCFFPDGDEIFGSLGELFVGAPGGVGFAFGNVVERPDGVFEAFRELGVLFCVFGEKWLKRGFQEDLEGVDESVEFFVAVAGHVAAGGGEKDSFEALLEFLVLGELFFEGHLAVDEVGCKGVGRHVDEFYSGVGRHMFDVFVGRDEEEHAGTGVDLFAERDGFLSVG